MVFNTGAALLDAIVLAVVSRENEGTYGYKITQDVRKVLDVSESTLYPVLRRLQKNAYLEVYDEILRQQGDLCFKTDNQRFFEWSLQEICQFGWLIQNISLDLHNSDFEGNVMTEYEEKFSAEGYRIYRLEARRRLPEFLKK